jgi:hypothetical protein
MPSPEEIIFSKNRFRLQDSLNECMSTAEQCFEAKWTSAGGDLMSFTGALLGHTIANQHLIHERIYEGNIKVGYIIAADHDWNPIVFITSSLSDPIQFNLDPELSGFAEVRKALITAIKATK